MSAIAEQILTGLPKSGWDAACISLLPSAYKNSSNNDSTLGLVDINGKAVARLDGDTWGIAYWVCQKYCTWDNIPARVSYEYFATSVAQYMLPWLALTAQLPFAAGSAQSNILSWCLALGSPALVTFSLVITILNRNHVRKTFSRLSKSTHRMIDETRLNAAERLLSESQQVPLHVCDSEKFKALVQLPLNVPWWNTLPARLKKSHRSVTPAFIAQYGLAVLAWAATISTTFVSTLDGNASATDLSCSNLWAWLLPVVAGWLIVDTQYTFNGIDEALAEGPLVYDGVSDVATNNPPEARATETVSTAVTDAELEATTADSSRPSADKSEGIDATQEQSAADKLTASPDCAIENRKDFFIAEPQRALATMCQVGQSCDSRNHHNPDAWTWHGFSVAGDMRQVGPVFNYARFLNHHNTLSAFILEFKRIPSTRTNSMDEAIGTTTAVQNNDCDSVTEGRKDFQAYQAFDQVPLHVWGNVAIATCAGLAVQWSTAGSSIVTAFFTVPKGFGCFSIYYTLYASCSTAVLALLLVSMLLSHAVMLKCRDHALGKAPSLGAGKTAIAAVVTRLVGKVLAITNALGLVIMSLLQLMGTVFSTCWCQALAASRGENAWVPLFRAPAELRDLSKHAWLGGLMMSVSVCVVIPVLFWFMVKLRKA